MLNFPVIKKSTIKLSGSRVLIVVLALKSTVQYWANFPLPHLHGQTKIVTFGNELFWKEIEQFEVAYRINRLGCWPNLIRMLSFLNEARD